MSPSARSLFWAIGVLCLASVAVKGGPPERGRREASPKADQPRLDRDGDPLPPGALLRLGTTRFRHPGWNKAVLFLPDGKTVVSKSESNSLRFWEAAGGKLLGEVRSDDPLFEAVALSPDGKTIYSAGRLLEADDGNYRRTFRVWDVATRKAVRSANGPDAEEAAALAFAPDRKTLFTLRGGNVQVWEVETGTELLDLRLSERTLRGLAVSPDGKLVAASEDGGALLLWEWQSDCPPRRIHAGTQQASRLVFSPDGKLLAGSVGWPAVVHVWEVASGRRLLRLAVPGGEHYSHDALAFSLDGKALAAAGRTGRGFVGAVHFWDLPAGEYRRRLDLGGDPAHSLAFSADGRRVVVGAESGVRVWELTAGKELMAEEETHRGRITRISVSPQGTIATASDDQTVRLWDSTTGRHRQVLGHGNWVRAVALSPDGKRVASSALDDTVRLWDARSGQQLYKLFGHGAVGGRRSLAFLPGGKRFLSWGDDWYLRMWDVKTGKAILEHAIRPSGIRFLEDEEDRHSDLFGGAFLSVSGSAFAPDGKRFVLEVGAHFHVFDVASGKELRTIPNITALR